MTDNKCLYTCGLCKSIVQLNPQNIVCIKCGHRILYKQRTSKSVEFIAR